MQATSISKAILEAYQQYKSSFEEITLRAKKRFLDHDWHAVQEDSKERLSLYKDIVRKLALQIIEKDFVHLQNLEYWNQVKEEYEKLIKDRPDADISSTFYNSVYRKVHPAKILSEEQIFLIGFKANSKDRSFIKSFEHLSSAEILVNKFLDLMGEGLLWEDRERDVSRVVAELEKEKLAQQWQKIEMVRDVFYRNKAAYIIGRIVLKDGNSVPLILPIMNLEGKLFVDTVLTRQDDLSIIFSFTRSYFFVMVDAPASMVSYLKEILPGKMRHELYNSIGFNKHGKTEFYREYLNFLDRSTEEFIIAPGIKGMVMSVFTMDGMEVVFKLIKDSFDPPKSMTRDQVKQKYRLVSEVDRVGRMADTHEFMNFRLPLDRVSSELMTELKKVSKQNLIFTDDSLIIKHLYTERRMVPLNIFLETAEREEAEEVVDEYGNSIKQLAAANIFPGDMLLKNFGVTRFNRVVFYDYDEITLLTDCNFRRMPVMRDEDEMHFSERISTQPNDIFPEEFRKFLIGRGEIREMFFSMHADIFDVEFWWDMQDKIRNGAVVDVFPYRRYKRFENRKDT